MSFISYAQNFEDVMLWRALKHIECGFYIDVGAYDPETDSVTKAFYDRGWRGINIEPVAQWCERLREVRIRDINLQLAAGAETGELTFYEVPDTGLSTMDRLIAERHETERGYKKQERVVTVRTLMEICRHYHEAPIHFLKIDVEGGEQQVLAGLDMTRIRPWIMVVESTLPNTQVEDHEEWESVILEADYQYVYFDGLNRFYVANEHAELKASFKAPPNVFDNFIRSQQLSSEHRAAEQEQRAVNAETRAAEQEQRATAAEHRAAEQEQRATEAEHRAAEQEQRATEAEYRAIELEQRAAKADARAEELEQRTTEAEHRAIELEQRVNTLETKVTELNASSHHWWQQADHLSRQVQIYANSRSWRYTYPLRATKAALTGSFTPLTAWLGKAVRYPMTFAMKIVLQRPRLARRINQRLLRYPKLRNRLLSIVRRSGIWQGQTAYRAHVLVANQTHSHNFPTLENSTALSQLTPRGRQIYHDLQNTLGDCRRKNG